MSGMLADSLGVFYVIMLNSDILVFCFGVLVGAFSDFGRLDTGNPVQILPLFSILLSLLGF